MDSLVSLELLLNFININFQIMFLCEEEEEEVSDVGDVRAVVDRSGVIEFLEVVSDYSFFPL